MLKIGTDVYRKFRFLLDRCYYILLRLITGVKGEVSRKKGSGRIMGFMGFLGFIKRFI